MSEQPRDDRELEAFLARESELSRSYRTESDDQPSAAIDEVILAASRREVASRPQPLRSVGADPGSSPPLWRRRSRAARWSVPLAAAAVLILAVALTLTLEREREVSIVSQGTPSAPALRGDSLSERAPAPHAEPVPRRQEDKARGARDRSVAVSKQQPAEVQQAPASASIVASPSPVSRDLAAKEEQVADALPPQAASVEGAGAEGETSRAAPIAKRTASGAVGKIEAQRDPQAWIDEMKRLLANGERARAQASLREFRKAYPDYRLPDVLRALEDAD